jgi:hypothetical protein
MHELYLHNPAASNCNTLQHIQEQHSSVHGGLDVSGALWGFSPEKTLKGCFPAQLGASATEPLSSRILCNKRARCGVQRWVM